MQKIIITHYKNSVEFVNICFIENGVIINAEPFEIKHHSQYVNIAELTEIE
ncbi:MAG: hypothetical protein RL308_1375 [Bacteroidota bacterium]|jgi:hypothetical protein